MQMVFRDGTIASGGIDPWCHCGSSRGSVEISTVVLFRMLGELSSCRSSLSIMCLGPRVARAPLLLIVLCVSYGSEVRVCRKPSKRKGSFRTPSSTINKLRARTASHDGNFRELSFDTKNAAIGFLDQEQTHFLPAVYTAVHPKWTESFEIDRNLPRQLSFAS